MPLNKRESKRIERPTERQKQSDNSPCPRAPFFRSIPVFIRKFFHLRNNITADQSHNNHVTAPLHRTEGKRAREKRGAIIKTPKPSTLLSSSHFLPQEPTEKPKQRQKNVANTLTSLISLFGSNPTSFDSTTPVSNATTALTVTRLVDRNGGIPCIPLLILHGSFSVRTDDGFHPNDPTYAISNTTQPHLRSHCKSFPSPPTFPPFLTRR